MADTCALLIKYYNNETAKKYGYDGADTVQSFLAKHPKIGDNQVSQLFVGSSMYNTSSQDTMLSIVQQLKPNEAALAFPKTLAIIITHIDIDQKQVSKHATIPSTWTLVELVNAMRVKFGIDVDAKCELSSDAEDILPGNVYQFDFEATEFYLQEVCKN
ncbi:hypothetical protein GGH96_002671 [Coemansia sp. RSA 1972]|nr:hypothetical protein GGH96_002671 [Coemansia sp. RSA 1972]